MYEEENQENRIGRREGDARDNVDGLRHPDRMRRLLLAHLHETRLCVTIGVGTRCGWAGGLDVRGTDSDANVCGKAREM